MFGYFIISMRDWLCYDKVFIPFRETHAISKLNEICAKYTGAGAREIGESDRAPP